MSQMDSFSAVLVLTFWGRDLEVERGGRREIHTQRAGERRRGGDRDEGSKWKRRGGMQSEKRLGKRKRQEQSVSLKGGERHAHSCSQGEERGWRSGPRETVRGLGCPPSWVGMGTWSFVYYPTRTDAGAAFFTGFWLPEMNAVPSSGAPGEPAWSREPCGLGSEWACVGWQRGLGGGGPGWLQAPR